MDLNTKLTVLERLGAIYDQFLSQFDLACKKHCAHCCTANVTMTTLEGFRIYNHLEKNGQLQYLKTVDQKARPRRFIPQVSINRMADICARDAELPVERMDPDAGACLLLENEACPLYAARPYGCRCMVSANNCGVSGAADMDPFILTVNDVFLQHLEHIDAQGYTGNVADVMQFLASEENRSGYARGTLGPPPAGLVANQPMFVLMVPPEHRERIQPLLTRIRSIQV